MEDFAQNAVGGRHNPKGPTVTSNWAICCTMNPPVLPLIPPEGVKVPGIFLYPFLDHSTIQGISWKRLNITRESYRRTRLEQYKNFENIPLSSDDVGKFITIFSGAEIGIFVVMLSNPSSVHKACTEFAVLQGVFVVHHVGLFTDEIGNKPSEKQRLWKLEDERETRIQKAKKLAEEL
ncbi:hypothetical protein Tco_0919568 [Tanacetum coccineum]